MNDEYKNRVLEIIQQLTPEDIVKMLKEHGIEVSNETDGPDIKTKIALNEVFERLNSLTDEEFEKRLEESSKSDLAADLEYLGVTIPYTLKTIAKSTECGRPMSAYFPKDNDESNII